MRFVLKYRTTEKVLAKDGLLCRQFQRKTDLNKMLFQISKLHKKRNMKSILRILLTEFSKTIFTPSFANTVLYDGVFSTQIFGFAIQC